MVEHKATSENNWLLQSNGPKSVDFLLHCLSVCISRNFWRASLLLVHGLFLNQNQRWLRSGGILILDIKSNEEDVNQKNNFHSKICSQTWSLPSWVFHTFLPCTFSLVVLSFVVKAFFSCLCPSYFSLWFRIVEQGEISRTHCLMCSPTCVSFFWDIFEHLTWQLTFRDSGWCPACEQATAEQADGFLQWEW